MVVVSLTQVAHIESLASQMAAVVTTSREKGRDAYGRVADLLSSPSYEVQASARDASAGDESMSHLERRVALRTEFEGRSSTRHAAEAFDKIARGVVNGLLSYHLGDAIDYRQTTAITRTHPHLNPGLVRRVLEVMPNREAITSAAREACALAFEEGYRSALVLAPPVYSSGVSPCSANPAPSSFDEFSRPAPAWPFISHAEYSPPGRFVSYAEGAYSTGARTGTGAGAAEGNASPLGRHTEQAPMQPVPVPPQQQERSSQPDAIGTWMASDMIPAPTPDANLSETD